MLLLLIQLISILTTENIYSVVFSFYGIIKNILPVVHYLNASINLYLKINSLILNDLRKI